MRKENLNSCLMGDMSLRYDEIMTGESETLKRANDYLMFFVDDLCEYDFSRRNHESDAEWAKRLYVKTNSLKALADDCRTRVMMLACCDISTGKESFQHDDYAV